MDDVYVIRMDGFLEGKVMALKGVIFNTHSFLAEDI